MRIWYRPASISMPAEAHFILWVSSFEKVVFNIIDFG